MRRRELADLLAPLADAPDGPVEVAGRSWLYQLPAYRRLFPPAFLASARAVAPPWQRMPLWGQLLDRHGHVRPAARDAFLRGLAQASAVDALASCFPLQVLALKAPAAVFTAA